MSASGASSATVLDCALSRWHPTAGDPGALAWIVAAVYGVSALLAFLAAFKVAFPAASTGRERTFWGLTALILAFLAVNKELDLQTLMTVVGRCTAVAQGWFEQRRAVQRDLILSMAVLVPAALAVMAWILRGTWRRTLLPICGLLLVSGYVLFRAASFHHVDTPAGQAIAGLRIDWLLELAGPLLIAGAALWLLGPSRSRRDATDGRVMR